jgi:hypothetical protein
MRPVFTKDYRTSVAVRIERRLWGRQMQQPEDRFWQISDDHGGKCKFPSRRKVSSRPPLLILYRHEFLRRQATVFIIVFS